jgi:outer membrane protein assembly factor BamB
MKLKHSRFFLVFLGLAILLSACAGGGASLATSWPGATIQDTTVYLAYSNQVHAIQLANGTQIWRYPAEPKTTPTFYAAPVLTSDGQLLVGDYTNTLYSINPQSGQENWKFTQATNHYIASPLATENAIFAPNADDTVYALDLKGNLLWKYKTGGALWAQPTADPACSCIYVPSMDHHLYAINAQNGALEWKSDDLGGSVVGHPTIGPDNVLYLGTFNSEMMAIQAEGGKVAWRVPTTGWVWGGPVLNDRILYFGDLKNNFYAMSASDGSIKWKYQADGPVAETPLLLNNNLYFTTLAGSLVSLDLNGNVRWTKAIGGKIYAPVVGGDDALLVAPVGAKDGLLFAFDSSGNPKWTFVPPK